MTFTIKSAYKKSPYRKKYTLKKYKDVLLTFFYGLSKLIIYDKYEYKIPLGGGTIKIIKVKGGKKRTLDYKHYKATGVKRFLLNRHSNGYYFMWHWNTRRSMFKHNKLFRLIPNRGNDGIIGARGLAKHVINCANDPYKKDYDVMGLTRY